LSILYVKHKGVLIFSSFFLLIIKIYRDVDGLAIKINLLPPQLKYVPPNCSSKYARLLLMKKIQLEGDN